MNHLVKPIRSSKTRGRTLFFNNSDREDSGPSTEAASLRPIPSLDLDKDTELVSGQGDSQELAREGVEEVAKWGTLQHSPWPSSSSAHGYADTHGH